MRAPPPPGWQRSALRWHGSPGWRGMRPSCPASRRHSSSCARSLTLTTRGGSLPAENVRAMRVGIGGPVGTGKSSLVASVCRILSSELELGVVTNDIYTTEDAEFLRSTGVLPLDRITAVQTGCCPHTAIRDDITANLEAVEDLERQHGALDIVFVESGGDNLTPVLR